MAGMSASRAPLTRLRLTLFSVVMSAVICTIACVPEPITCELFTLDHPEAYTVLSRYERSFFSTDCPSHSPQEVLIKRDNYSVYVFLRANNPGQVWLGLRPFGSSRFVLGGAGLRVVSGDSAFRDRASHFFRAAYSSDGRLAFQVLDRETNQTDTFSFSLGLVQCTCKTYDGP
jgi:hypothetical protein